MRVRGSRHQDCSENLSEPDKKIFLYFFKFLRKGKNFAELASVFFSEFFFPKCVVGLLTFLALVLLYVHTVLQGLP